MPSIRDFTSALRRRPGVQSVILVDRAGLLIDGFVPPGVDDDDLAARLPGLITELDSLGDALAMGEVRTCIAEYGKDYAIASPVSADTILLVVLAAHGDLGSLLFELRQHRSNIAALT